MGLLLAALARRPRIGDICLVETATYWHAHSILQEAGFSLEQVAHRSAGEIDMHDLARQLDRPQVRATKQQ